MGTVEARNETTFSFSALVIRVADLQEAFSASKEAKHGLETRCAFLQKQLADARTRLHSQKSEMNELLKQAKEKEGLLQSKIQNLQHQGDASKVQAETLAANLDRLSSSREQALLDAKERCRTAEYGLAMKTEECKRLQEQQNAFSALVSTLEADLGAANASMSDARTMVTENRQAMQKQKAWIQTAMVREEELIEMCDEHLNALALERQQHTKTKQALSNKIATAAALEKETDERKAQVDELLAERAALQDEVAKHKEHQAKAQQHLERSNELLRNATAAIQSHEAALESMESKLAAIDSSKAQTAAANGAVLAEQEQELALLRTEVAAVKGSHRESIKAVPADSMIPMTAPAPLQGTEGAHQGKAGTQGSRGGSASRGERMVHHAEHNKGTSGPAQSQGEASLGSQSHADAGGDHKLAGGTAEEISSHPCKAPAQQVSTDGAPALGKRQRPLLHPLLKPTSALQPAADTPDELEVLSETCNRTEDLVCPAKKPCLQPASYNSQKSHLSQTLPGEDGLVMDMSASEEVPVRQEVMPLRSSREAPLSPAAAQATNAAQNMLTEDGQPGAPALSSHSAELEGGKVEQSAKISQADVFYAFAAFEGMEEVD